MGSRVFCILYHFGDTVLSSRMFQKAWWMNWFFQPTIIIDISPSAHFPPIFNPSPSILCSLELFLSIWRVTFLKILKASLPTRCPYFVKTPTWAFWSFCLFGIFNFVFGGLVWAILNGMPWDYSSLCAQGFTPGTAKKQLVEIKAEMDAYKASVWIDYPVHEVLCGRVPFISFIGQALYH